jgi:phytoene dehydrogenase-like protein
MDVFDVIIVGAGVSGLVAAYELQKKGLNVKILEVANEPGGRMRSDFYGGFILDKGFHLFLNGLPEPKKVLDIDSLKLKTIYPGLLIKYGSGFNIVSNPLKKTFDLISMSIGDNSTLWDKFKMGKLFNHIQNLSFEEIFEMPERSSLEFLTDYGFSNKLIQSFFKPLISTAFLENEMKTSCRLLHFNLKMLFTEDVSLPENGIGAIPKQLADKLLSNTIRYGAKVKHVEAHKVELSSGEMLYCKSVIMSCTPIDLEKIYPSFKNTTNCLSVSNIYFSAENPPVNKPIVMLNGEGKGIVNNVFVPSLVQPNYAPKGMHLVSVNITKPNDFDDYELVDQVLSELSDWFGVKVNDWRHLKTYHIKYAIPRKCNVDFKVYSQQIEPSIFLCGDYLSYGSLNAAIKSGKEVSKSVMSNWNEINKQENLFSKAI